MKKEMFGNTKSLIFKNNSESNNNILFKSSLINSSAELRFVLMFIGILLIILSSIFIISAIGSSSYNISNPTAVPGGNASSINYSTGLVIGDISGNASSTNYQTGLGFYYSWLNYSQSDIILNQGWNLVSLYMRRADSGTDRNISIVSGWNLIGYSSGNNVSIENIRYTNSSGSSYNWSNAVANNKINAYFAYFDNTPASPSERKYKYVATSDLGMDDTKLMPNVGYWMYANEAGNLTLPLVGGSYTNETYGYSRLRFWNGTTEVSISQAGLGGYSWIEDTFQYWNTANSRFQYISSLNFGLYKNTLTPWVGVFVWSNYDNITLIRQN